MAKSEIRRKLTFQVEFDEVDMLGIVHNSVYFKWFERGRLRLIDEILSIKETLPKGIALFVVKNMCEYQQPATLQDQLILITRMPIADPYPGKIIFYHELANTKTRKTIALGETTLALVDVNTRTLIRDVPPAMMQTIRQFR